jgi:hypothetical protein
VSLSARPVASVTERFVTRFATTTERYPVSDLIGESIRGYDRDTPTDPERSRHRSPRLLDNPDGFFECRLDRSVGLFIPYHEASRMTVCRHFYRHFSRFQVRRLTNKVPDPLPAHAETGMGTEPRCIRKRDIRTFDPPGTFHIGHSAGRFCPIEGDLPVCSITEGHVLRTAASTKRIGICGRVMFSFFPAD